MMNNQSISIEQIIAKLDNDFNLDNSDWIPRIAAWTIEVLSILKCTKKEIKTEVVVISDKIGTLPNDIDFRVAKLYDENGCEIKNIEDDLKCCRGFNPVGRDEQIAIPIDPTDSLTDYVTTSRLRPKFKCNRGYIILNNRQFELNFNTDKVTVKYKAIKTYYSETYGCDLPVVPNNYLLLDCITYYCMYKILCRGYKHPVMNLGASQYGTNPYFMWQHLKDEAKRSVIIDEQGEVVDDGGQWRKSFFNFTFNPKD